MFDTVVALINLVVIALLAIQGIDKSNRKPWVILVAVLGIVIGVIQTHRTVKSQNALIGQVTGAPAHLELFACVDPVPGLCGRDEAHIFISPTSEHDSAHSIIVELTDTSGQTRYTQFQTPEIVPGRSISIDSFNIKLNDRDSADLIAVVSTRAGTVKQEIAFRRDKTRRWAWTWRLSGVQDRVYLTPEFPAEAKAGIEWLRN
jgi:hypothetical protein